MGFRVLYPGSVPPSVSASTRVVSESSVRRLSLYLRVLEELAAEGERAVSSEEVAARAGTTAAQVRKDLSTFGSFGKRGLGYPTRELSIHLRDILGLTRSWKVVLVGAGRIGAALFEYPHFRDRGFEIVAVLDADPGKVGTRWGGRRIRPVTELETAIREEGAEILILTVPAPFAQEIAERAVASGVRGVLNFAPTPLRLPAGVEVNEVDMSLELEALSYALHSRRCR